jgi:hypothetical protein
MLTNTRTVRIEWGDCDPAGIIFYPRYFAIFDTSTTMLIERAAGMKKIEYLKAYAIAGHPVVETRAKFRLPTRFGDDRASPHPGRCACGRGLGDAGVGRPRSRRPDAHQSASHTARDRRAADAWQLIAVLFPDGAKVR